MILYHNQEFIDATSAHVSYTNRGFQYGDGFFETLIALDGKVRFFEQHFLRLQKGLQLLSFSNPLLSDKNLLIETINTLLHKNYITHRARIKIIVYRSHGGLYSPESNQAEVMIECKSIESFQFKIKEHAIYSEKYQNYLQPYSCIKTLSALKYVVCGIEMKNALADEIILLDNDGNISECLQSSIFWIENNTIYTPTIDTGCIEGIMRHQIIDYCNKMGIKINIGYFTPTQLSNADLVFSCNVTGLMPIKKIGQSIFKTEHPIFSQLCKALH